MELKTEVPKVERLEKMGFVAAAKRQQDLKTQQRKLAIAYEHYRYVTPEKLQKFQAKLVKETTNWDNMGGYHRLDFVPIAEYKETPPAFVLDALEAAQDRQCFDSYEIAYIKKVNDPLLFGRIDGCAKRFFITQWDHDVSIDDILKKNEG